MDKLLISLTVNVENEPADTMSNPAMQSQEPMLCKNSCIRVFLDLIKT